MALTVKPSGLRQAPASHRRLSATREFTFNPNFDILETNDRSIGFQHIFSFSGELFMANYAFKTEVNQLLNLITHSLYSHKEVFLRELISNASDAIDKLKYLTVSDDAFKTLSFEPRITVTLDEDAKTITVSDNGIGMDEEELADNLGTIARSGTRAFLERLGENERKASNLIGQFGVGF
ncbi:MAG TPA: hypothetical protein DHU26_07705, partial [Spirochaetaceae bacterium]|nr:hypothetical protein [Spirochaetaceae bacterium]